MLPIIHEFLNFAAESGLTFYNEFTLQMELALFIRQHHPHLRVQLERPITDFGARQMGGKKEIDICVLDQTHQLIAAIEIKLPSNGRVPESMFDYCRDIQFAESLVRAGFRSAYAFILTPDHLFRNGRETSGIYRYFRGNEVIQGTIQKPTGARDKTIEIEGCYSIRWNTHHRGFIYAITEVGCAQ